MDAFGSALPDDHAAHPPDICVICEERSLIRTLLSSWMEQSFPFRLIHVNHAEEIEEEHYQARLLVLSARSTLFDGELAPKKAHFVPIVFDDGFTSHNARWWKVRGAKGLLDLRDSAECWAHCISVVLAGGEAATPAASSALEEANEKHGLQLLSKREMQVAQHLVRGLSAEQVAKKLGTTVGTIKNQRKAVYGKLKILRATQLPWAMGNGVGRSGVRL